MNRMHAAVASLALAATLASTGGCVERKISFTSTPPGALVWLNEREIGRTPCETEIVYFGEYDVRVELDGFEPIVTHRAADGGAWENPPLDFFAEIWPGKVLSETLFHFDLVTRDDSEPALLDRATMLRDRIEAEHAAQPETGQEILDDLKNEVEDRPAQTPAQF